MLRRDVRGLDGRERGASDALHDVASERGVGGGEELEDPLPELLSDEVDGSGERARHCRTARSGLGQRSAYR